MLVFNCIYFNYLFILINYYFFFLPGCGWLFQYLMGKSTRQIAGLTDGMREDCMVHAVGRYNRLRAGELTPAQSRSWLEFISSMAALHTLWLSAMDSRNAINVSGYYEDKLFQTCCIVIWVWMFDWFWRHPEVFSAFIPSGVLYLNCPPCFSAPAIMPCRRGIPRRGSHSGNRGSLSRPAPQIIALIALAPPSSPPLDQDRFPLNNSYQTSRFTF